MTDPRRAMADYASLIETYGIPDEEIRRWIDSNPRPVPVIPGALYVRRTVPTTAVRARRRWRARGDFSWRLVWPALFAAAAAVGLIIAGYMVFRFPPSAPAPCHPGACQVITPSTIPPPPR